MPLDTRHDLAKKRKRYSDRQITAMAARPEVVGGVRGFPKEWLDSPSIPSEQPANA